MLGMHGTAFANYAVDDCDFLIAVGARFDDRVAGVPAKFARVAKFIAHLDVDSAEINKVKRVQWHHVGDIREALATLRAAGERLGFKKDLGEWHQHAAELKKTYALNYDRASALIQPNHVIEEINKLTRGEAIIATGVGQHQMWAAQYFDFRQPRLLLTSGSMGTMGFGLPAAMGAKVAHPGKLVIDIDGDGSFLMNIQELACCYAEKIAPKVLLLNNQHLGMVVQWEDRFFGSNRGHTYLGAGEDAASYPDFVTVAMGFGVRAKSVWDKADLDAALAEMIESDGAFVLDVHVPHQEHVLPMIPAGMTVKDIIKA